MDKNFVYELPFVSDVEDSFIYDNTGLYSFMFLMSLNTAQLNKILESINSEDYKPLKYKDPVKFDYLKDRKVITMNGRDFILLRGWYSLLELGYMTIEAEEIQESLVKFLINKMQ
jgi:hypothetical protein